MVSLKTIFKRYKVFFVLTSFFLLVGAVQSFAAVSLDGTLLCLDGYKSCCVDGAMTCVEDTGQICLASCGTLEAIETCTEEGIVQYQPSGTCGTTSRTCCGLSWSDWGAECPKTCSSSTKPTTYQTCTASNGNSGTMTRTVTCDTSTGEWTTGSWGTCTAPDCTSGETKTCPSNSNQVLKCTSSGTWSTSCSCENPGNGKVYCQGMAITVAQSSTCYHGIWSDTTCTGICCCGEDTPKLMSDGTPGCYGPNALGTYMWQYSCVCQTASQIEESSGLLAN